MKRCEQNTYLLSNSQYRFWFKSINRQQLYFSISYVCALGLQSDISQILTLIISQLVVVHYKLTAFISRPMSYIHDWSNRLMRQLVYPPVQRR